VYSLDFRKRILKIGEEQDLSIRELAKKYTIASRSIVNWKKRIDPILKRSKKPTKIDSEALRADVENHPDSYQYERAERLGASKSGIGRALKRLRITYKKNSKTPKSRRNQAI
jgi:transposase